MEATTTSRGLTLHPMRPCCFRSRAARGARPAPGTGWLIALPSEGETNAPGSRGGWCLMHRTLPMHIRRLPVSIRRLAGAALLAPSVRCDGHLRAGRAASDPRLLPERGCGIWSATKRLILEAAADPGLDPRQRQELLQLVGEPAPSPEPHRPPARPAPETVSPGQAPGSSMESGRNWHLPRERGRLRSDDSLPAIAPWSSVGVDAADSRTGTGSSTCRRRPPSWSRLLPPVVPLRRATDTPPRGTRPTIGCSSLAVTVTAI